MTLTKGKTLSFRIPSEFDDKVVDILTMQKEKLGKGFSKYLANLVSEAIESDLANDEKDILKINVSGLSSQEKKWLNDTTNLQILIKVLSTSAVPVVSKNNLLENNSAFKTKINTVKKNSLNSDEVIETLHLHNSTEDFILSQFLNP